MNIVVACGYVVFGGIACGVIGWSYVLWCVDRSVKLVERNIAESEYSEEEIQVIRNFLDGSLNKIK